MSKKRNLIIGLITISAIWYVSNEVNDRYKEKKAGEQALKDSINQTVNITEQINQRNGSSQSIPLLSTDEIKGKDINSVMAVIMRRHVNRMVQQTREYENGLKELNIESLLSAKRLTQDKDMSKSNTILKKAYQLQQAQNPRYLANIDLFITDIKNTELSDSQKTKLLNTISTKLQTTKPKAAELHELEGKILDEFSAQLEMLKNRSMWKAQGDEILFKKQSDVNKFNAHTLKVQEYSKRQDAIAEEMINDLKFHANQTNNQLK